MPPSVPLTDLEPNELLSINTPDFPADFSIAEQHTLLFSKKTEVS